MTSISQKYIIFLLALILCSCNKNRSTDFSAFSPAGDLALNNGYSLYPNPSGSDNGWGGAPFKWHIVDGIRTKSNYWNMGLAFTGGIYEYIDTCGWRQATVDFGSPLYFNRVIIWLNANNVQLLPDSFMIQHWDDESMMWVVTKSVENKREQIGPVVRVIEKACIKKKLAMVIPYEEAFPQVRSSKVRFVFNNCDIEHGWINEFEVYYDQAPM